ncbi:uncharacterized protein LOC117641693 isoform X2 [Thrips palmi]|uniref:Uncharacterized protein LOC117641693 isoform X2 n=1 Tax=Thrips palmi TaxID=161013 RepID=A0A6P8Y668_THRPL|nr:uncharacterized protein LOC117641693 isoform X2 [Thrips palmi]
MKQYESVPSDHRQSTGRSLLDVLLVVLCVALLLAVGVMLRPHPQTHALPDAADLDVPVIPDDPDAPRQRLMSLGIALLLVSLGVCLYTMYRLGFCCMRREYNRARLRSGIPSVNSRLHLISATDLPPTYDAIMLSRGSVHSVDLQPPSYFTIVIQQDDTACSRSSRPGCAGCAAPRTHCCEAAASEAGCASRPQEAG